MMRPTAMNAWYVRKTTPTDAIAAQIVRHGTGGLGVAATRTDGRSGVAVAGGWSTPNYCAGRHGPTDHRRREEVTAAGCGPVRDQPAAHRHGPRALCRRQGDRGRPAR